jgi:hypothetical protein
MPQHMRVGFEFQAGASRGALDHPAEAELGERRAATKANSYAAQTGASPAVRLGGWRLPRARASRRDEEAGI